MRPVERSQPSSSVIPESTGPSRIAENVDVFDFELTDFELTDFELTDAELTALDGLETGVRVRVRVRARMRVPGEGAVRRPGVSP